MGKIPTTMFLILMMSTSMNFPGFYFDYLVFELNLDYFNHLNCLNSVNDPNVPILKCYVIFALLIDNMNLYFSFDVLMESLHVFVIT